MAASRIDVFKGMLESDPDNTAILFGLAKEYEKAGRHAEVIATLKEYLARADDEGNAYGMLAKAYSATGDQESARAAYRKGIEVAQAHGHPSMAADYQMMIDMDDEEI